MNNKSFYVPPDYREFEKYGTCGEACIVVLTKSPSVEGQANYQNQKYGHLYTNVGEMKEMLEMSGYTIKKRGGLKRTTLPEPTTNQALVFIQYLKEDGTEYYWREAQTHTHWILMQKEEEQWWVFCNSKGWMKKEDYHDLEVDQGYIRSYLELSKEKM